jgi:hypothetical protein
VIGTFATRVCISFPTSEKFFPKNKTTLTGNPLRKEIIEVKKEKKQKNALPLIFITGGSTGSQAINRVIADVLPSLLKKYTVVHQTGAANAGEDGKYLERIVASLPLDEKESEKREMPHPNIVCEWGRYIAAPAQINIYKIIDTKKIHSKKADAKKWYVLDGSFMNDLCDTWAIKQNWAIGPANNLNHFQHISYRIILFQI